MPRLQAEAPLPDLLPLYAYDELLPSRHAEGRLGWGWRPGTTAAGQGQWCCDPERRCFSLPLSTAAVSGKLTSPYFQNSTRCVCVRDP